MHAMPLSLVAVCLMVLGLLSSPSEAATRLGLHVTQEELNCWRQRAGLVPPNSLTPNCTVKYKTQGDVSTNSRGDWDRTVSQAGGFFSSPAADRWAGQPAGSCWWAGAAAPADPGKTRGIGIRDAAFYYLMTGNLSYRSAVLNELLAQVATPGTDFSDSVRWVASPSCAYGDAWSHGISMWITRNLYAYDYLKAGDQVHGQSLSVANKNTLDTWFLNGGNFWESVYANFVEEIFPNRNSDDYVNLGPGYPSAACGGNWWCKAYYEQPDNIPSTAAYWNNRSMQHARMFTLVGVTLDNTFLKNQGKRFFKEWLRMCIFPEGMACEMGNWYIDYPGLGWSYTGHSIGSMITIADVLARNGDTELYDFSTSQGYPTNGMPNGGPKSLLSVITHYLNYVDHTLLRHGTDQASLSTNPDWLIDSTNNPTGEEWIHDTIMAQANIYYQNTYVKNVYMRTAAGTPAYPEFPSDGGWEPGQGEWGIYPGVAFLFGQQEGVVDPFALGPTGPDFTFTASSPVASGTASTLTYGPVTSEGTGLICTPSIQFGAADTIWTNTLSADLIAGTGSPKLGSPRTGTTVYRMSCTDSIGTVDKDQTVNIQTPCSPTAHWTLNQTANPSTDAIAGISCTWTNSPTSVAGQFSTAVGVDGTTNQYLDCGSSSVMAPAFPFSLAFWMRVSGTPGGFGAVLGRTTSGSWDDGYAVWWNDASTLRFFINSYTNNNAQVTIGTLNQWNHLVAIYDGAEVQLWLNGVQGTDGAQTGAVSHGGSFMLGTVAAHPDSDTSGLQLDEVWMANCAMNASQINTLMTTNSFGGGDTTPPAAPINLRLVSP